MSAEAEVARMIEAGELSPTASAKALRFMAARWLAGQVRQRERRMARRGESGVRVNRSDEAVAAAREAATSFAARLEVDWPALFDKVFALPDGSRVTWGAATGAQHEARAAMLEIMAAGDIETAALHRAAVAEIARNGGDTLGGVDYV